MNKGQKGSDISKHRGSTSDCKNLASLIQNQPGNKCVSYKDGVLTYLYNDDAIKQRSVQRKQPLMEAGVRFGMASVLRHMWCMVCSLPIAWSHFVQVLQFFTPKLTIYIESEISSTLTASFFSFIFNCVSLLHHCSLFTHLHTARQWLRSKHKHKIKTEP